MPKDYTRPTLVERATRSPGKCWVTGDIDGPFIDFGVKFDPAIFNNKNLWSRLYLHAPLIEQIARDSLDMVPRSEVEDLARRVREAEAEVIQIRLKAEKISEAEEILAGVSA